MSRRSIGLGTAFMMVFMALLVDGTQGFLSWILVGFFVNPIIDVCVAMMFGIWFSHHGVSMMSAKNIAPFLGTIVGEFLPFISALPLWTFYIIFALIRNRVKTTVEPTPVRNRGTWRL